jgi:hypothetical protein
MKDIQSMSEQEQRERYGPVGSGEMGFLRGLGYYTITEPIEGMAKKIRNKFRLPIKWEWPAALMGGAVSVLGGDILLVTILGRDWSVTQKAIMGVCTVGMLGGAFIAGRAYESLNRNRGRGLYLPMSPQEERETFQRTESGVLLPPTTLVPPSAELVVPNYDFSSEGQYHRTVGEILKYSQQNKHN